MRRVFAIYAAALAGIGATSTAFAQQTTIFRNGENGYTGASDIRIGAKPGNNTNGATTNTDTASYFLDGAERGDGIVSDVTDGLIRFDNIVGAGAIPANALIINATLDVRTTTNSNSQTGGGYSVYALTSPFNSTTTWGTDPFGSDGTVGNNGLKGGYFNRPAVGAWTGARVDRIVQDWVNGNSPNHGFAIRSDDTTDGWSFNATGAATVANRPGLTVNYTTNPLAQERRYQESVNGYSGTYDTSINGFNAATLGVSVDGWFRETTGIDGSDGGTSYDQPYMIKFNNIDLSIPSITKAELTITTSNSGSADTGGPFTIHRILKPWDENTTYASLDSDNNPELNQFDELVANGFIAPASATLGYTPIAGQVTFDITDIAQAWKDGEANYGVYIGPGTANAWAVFTSGSGDPMLAPELRLLYVPVSVPEPASLGVLAVGGLLMLRRRRRGHCG